MMHTAAAKANASVRPSENAGAIRCGKNERLVR